MKGKLLKPIIFVDNHLIYKLKEATASLEFLYNTDVELNMDNVFTRNEVELQLTMLLTKISKNELESMLIDSIDSINIFKDYIYAKGGYQEGINLDNIDNLMKLFKNISEVMRFYKKYNVITNERLNKKVKKSLSEPTLLDLTSKVDELKDDDVIDIQSLVIIGLESEDKNIILHSIEDKALFNLAYRYMLEANFLKDKLCNASNDENFTSIILPYLRTNMKNNKKQGE